MASINISQDRVVNEFIELVSIDAVSFNERQIADVMKNKLLNLGFEVEEDEVYKHIGGNTGNIFAVLKGNIPGEPILFGAHIDTAKPGISKKAIVQEDGIITSDGTTVLGADDVSAIVEILEGVRAVKESGVAHRDVEIIFAVAEEVYSKGSALFDYEKVNSKEAYVLDALGPVGTAIVKAPTIISFTVEIKGRASHAGFEPEKGIHSIQLMSNAITNLKLGHIDEDTTLNVGLIEGGSVTNAVPASCICHGEVRSYDHKKALDTTEYVRNIFDDAIKGTEATVSMDYNVDITAYSIDESANVVKRFKDALSSMGIEAQIRATFGGSDNNNFVLHNINGIVLSCGMYNPHTVDEYTKVEDLRKGAELVAKLIRT